MPDLHPEVLALIAAGPQRPTPCPLCKGYAVRVFRGFTGKEATHWCSACKGTGGIEETPEEFARRIALRAVELEREECARVCEAWLYEADDDFLNSRGDEERVPYEVSQATIRNCADAIRRRGKP